MTWRRGGVTWSGVCMPSRQGALTVVAEVKPELKTSLLVLLNAIVDADVEETDLFPFKALSTIHFARWLVLDDRRGRWRGPLDHPPRPLLLILSTNYDGSLKDHLSELVQIAGPGLGRVLGHCVGFPSQGMRTRDSVLMYLKQHSIKPATFYRGAPGRTVTQIKCEAELREKIEGFLDQNRDNLKDLDPLAVRGRIQEYVAAVFPDDKPPPPTRFKTLKKLLFVIRLLLGVLLHLPLLVLLRRHERRDDQRREAGRVDRLTPAQIRSHNEWIADLARREDHITQNQISNLVPVRPGWYRLVVLRAVLAAIDRLAPVVYDRGQLGGIPTIHFARWVIVGRGRWLLFMSNYDGSWEEYLGAFIDHASHGLTAVWSNTVGFPRTKWLLWEGSRDERAFKDWVRGHQIATQVWYSAYSDLTVRQINQNTAIHAGLYGNLTQQQARMWLRRL